MYISLRHIASILFIPEKVKGFTKWKIYKNTYGPFFFVLEKSGLMENFSKLLILGRLENICLIFIKQTFPMGVLSHLVGERHYLEISLEIILINN